MTYISLFAGIGGFDLALNKLGHECVYVNEWDKYAAKIYEKNFKLMVDTRDIREVRTTEIPNHDLLVGGFPCQSFSIAGKRRGFEDTRGTMFYEIARIIRDKRPTYLFLENVKGLLAHDNGQTFKTIMWALDELGYECQWQVLNSKDFGVPQNRERVYIVGHLRGKSRPKIFPITKNVEISAAHIEGRWGGLKERRTEEAKRIRREMLKTGRDWSPRREKELVARTDNIIGALTATNNMESLVTDGKRIRRLTPIERERLQGFPDNWTEGVSNYHRYKQLGNAVTVNVINYIAKLLP